MDQEPGWVHKQTSSPEQPARQVRRFLGTELRTRTSMPSELASIIMRAPQIRIVSTPHARSRNGSYKAN